MSTSLAIPDFPTEKIELIKKMVARDCTNDELELFLYTCKRTGLDPLARQIYAVKRSGKMAIQTGIDGYRLIADRTGRLAGISDYAFDSEEGKFPNKATVTVKKALDGGVVADFTATARWGEYNAGGPMWAKMPYLMLGKCAEALALRKAFPADLSGVYTTEEMAQADNAQQEAAVTAEVERQKAAYTPTSGAAGMTLAEITSGNQRQVNADVPPELDWSYQKATGILICRILSVESRAKKGGKGEYLTVKVNGQVGGKFPDLLTYFHNSHRGALQAATGKVVKLEVEVKGDFANIETVLEIDGEKVPDAHEDYETQARLLASNLDFDEEELRELYTRWAKGSWKDTLSKLMDEKARREAVTA